MSNLLSRIPRETKIAAAILGVAILQVAVLAFFGLRGADERRDGLLETLAAGARRTVETDVVARGRRGVAELRETVESELGREAPLADRIASALRRSPAFEHAFVVRARPPLAPRLHEYRRWPLDTVRAVRIDDAARRAVRRLAAEHVTPENATFKSAAAERLADATDDPVARALALRHAWVSARVGAQTERALALAERVRDELTGVIDDRGVRADGAPLDLSASAAITDVWLDALVSSVVDPAPFVEALVDRRVRAQRYRTILSDAVYAVEVAECERIARAAIPNMDVETKREMQRALQTCADIDAADRRVRALDERALRTALERGGGWLTGGSGPDAIAATVVPATGDDSDVLAVLFAAPRDRLVEPFVVAARDAVDAGGTRADGLALLVRDAGGRTLVGPADVDSLVEPQPLIAALPGVWAGAALVDEEALDRATSRERRLWLWILVGAGLAVVAAGLLAARAVMREVRLARLKGDFVSNLSHELRTPLTSLRMFVETLQEGRVRDPAEAQEYLDVIGRETGRLSTLVDRILQFASFSRGRAPIELRSTDAGDVARRAHRIFEARAAAARAGCALEIDDRLPEALLDRDAMIQVLLNLLDNAVKYGGDKGATGGAGAGGRGTRIVLAVRGDKGRVRYEVEDDGPGVPERERELVFEEFYRGDESLSSGKQGTGIGLALCRRIVLAHGGSISVERGARWGGARFVVALPEAARGRRLALAARAEASR